MEERIVKGQAYRVFKDGEWDRLSFWKKASDVVFEDETTMEQNQPISILKRNHEYHTGDVAYEHTAPSWALLVCTNGGGVTANELPSTYSSVTPGVVVQDGEVAFTVYNVKPSSMLSESMYEIPTVSLLAGSAGQLAVDSDVSFNFYCKDGKYGFYTDPERKDETFISF